MNKLLGSAVLVVVLGASAAGAATVSGKIEHVDPHHDRITVNNQVFSMKPQTFHTAKLHRGERVHVTYHWQHGHRWATAVKVG